MRWWSQVTKPEGPVSGGGGARAGLGGDGGAARPEPPELLLPTLSSFLSALRPLPPRSAGPQLQRRRDFGVAGASRWRRRRRRPRPAWARRAGRSRSERSGGGAAGAAGRRSCGEPGWQRPLRGGDAAGRDGARVCWVACAGGEDSVAVGGWGAGRGAVGSFGAPWIAGWRRLEDENVAFGGMNEELGKRLPTPPGKRIGRRARACVCVCV